MCEAIKKKKHWEQRKNKLQANIFTLPVSLWIFLLYSLLKETRRSSPINLSHQQEPMRSSWITVTKPGCWDAENAKGHESLETCKVKHQLFQQRVKYPLLFLGNQFQIYLFFFFFWEFKCNCCTDMLHNFKSSHRLPPWLPKSIQHVRFIYHLFKFACSCNQIAVGFPLPLILENWYDKKLFPLSIVWEAPKVWLL
jgi:hypothetical protein